jgi:hypothetical protein
MTNIKVKNKIHLKGVITALSISIPKYLIYKITIFKIFTVAFEKRYFI